jgi:hypothetical protein
MKMTEIGEIFWLLFPMLQVMYSVWQRTASFWAIFITNASGHPASNQSRKMQHSNDTASARVARWFVFKPKIPIWEKISGSWIGSCRYILWTFGTFYGHLGYFMTIWYIVCSFGTVFPVLVSCTKKNLATLPRPALMERDLLHFPRIEKNTQRFYSSKNNHFLRRST